MIPREMFAVLLALCGVAALTAREPQLGNLRLAVGERVRYQMTFTSTVELLRSGVVEDPQAPGKVGLYVSATVSIEPLMLPADRAELKIRFTFDETASRIVSDFYEPTADALGEEYRALRGKSFEFVRTAEGKLRAGADFREAVRTELAANRVTEWLDELLGSSGIPPGTKPGQKWSSQEALSEGPFSGMLRRTESTYVRDGPCRHAGYEDVKAQLTRQYGSENCAVVLTRATIRRAANAPSDLTAPEYRARGMRTAGHWSGSGETLKYISLARGLLVSSASHWDEKLELTVMLEGARFQQSSRVKAGGQIVQLSPAALPDVRK